VEPPRIFYMHMYMYMYTYTERVFLCRGGGAACCNTLQYGSRVVTINCFYTKLSVGHNCVVYCSMLQYVAVCCNVLQCVAACCGAPKYHVLSSPQQGTSVQCVAVCCSVLQCCQIFVLSLLTRRCSNVLQSVL